MSGLPIEGPDADSRIQGGLLADGVNSFLACLMTCPSDAWGHANTKSLRDLAMRKSARLGFRVSGSGCRVYRV